MPTTGPWVSTTQTAELTASDGQAGDELGWSVAVSGGTIVAGARGVQVGSNDSQGAVYAYTEPAGGWATTNAFSAKLSASDGDTGDGLGYSVAVSGTTIVGGAPRHDADSSTADFGAAYVFGPGPATVKVGSVSSGHGELTAAFSCPAAGTACEPASFKATVDEHFKGGKLTAVTASKKPTTSKQVVVASGAVTLSAGTDKKLTLELNSTGRALLSKFGKLKAIVTISSGGKTIKTVTVTVLVAEKAKSKKKK
jgi:hypothetical protein